MDNTGAIKENETKIQALIAEGIAVNQLKVDLEEKISKMDIERSTFNEKTRLELLISKLDAEIANKRAEFKEKKQLLKEINDNKAAIQENNRIDASLNIVNQNIKTEESIRYTANERAVSFKKDIERCKSDIIDKEVIISRQELIRIFKNLNDVLRGEDLSA